MLSDKDKEPNQFITALQDNDEINYNKNFRNKFFRHFCYMPNEQKVNFWL